MLHPTVGRILSAVGAAVTVAALFLTWYHVDRPGAGIDDDTTGWQTFTRLRWVVLGGAGLTLVSALLAQTRPVLIARTVLGLLVAALIFRRIVAPPDLDATLEPQIGLWIGVVGALLIAAGGLVDTGRKVVEAYPDFPLWGRPVAELGAGDDRDERFDKPAPPAQGGAVTIDAEYEVLEPDNTPPRSQS
jgi:hypothetical protein